MGCAGSKTKAREEDARAPSSATEEAVKPRGRDEVKPIVDSERGEVEVTAAAAEEIEIVDATYVVSRAMGDDSAREMVENDAVYAETTTEAHLEE